jgi:hypothetical protein
MSVRFWPNPAVRLSIAGCQAGKSQTVTTGSIRPKADIGLPKSIGLQLP